VNTTGGTAIASVLRHALNQDDVASIVIVSDGYVEDVDTSVKHQLEERGITVESVISDSGNSSPLNELGRVTKLDQQ
jgi:superfamily I DNA and RNA helicase